MTETVLQKIWISYGNFDSNLHHRELLLEEIYIRNGNKITPLIIQNHQIVHNNEPFIIDTPIFLPQKFNFYKKLLQNNMPSINIENIEIIEHMFQNRDIYFHCANPIRIPQVFRAEGRSKKQENEFVRNNIRMFLSEQFPEIFILEENYFNSNFIIK
jgi:hypothetical protein